MRFEAVAHRILVVPDAVEETSAGGIIIATDQKIEMNAQDRGTIIHIGEDAWAAFSTKQPFAGLKVGDRVGYARYAGKWVKHPVTKQEVVALNDEDIVVKEVLEPGDVGYADSNQLAS